SLGVLGFDRQVLEAVGRKDLPIAVRSGRVSEASNGRESAASACHRVAVRFLPALREVPRRLLPGARPSGFRPSSPCDRLSPCGLVRSARALFLPATVPGAWPGQPPGRCCFYRCNGPKGVRSVATIPPAFASSLPWCRVR